MPAYTVVAERKMLVYDPPATEVSWSPQGHKFGNISAAAGRCEGREGNEPCRSPALLGCIVMGQGDWGLAAERTGSGVVKREGSGGNRYIG